jgi:hypothetical protein
MVGLQWSRWAVGRVRTKLWRSLRSGTLAVEVIDSIIFSLFGVLRVAVVLPIMFRTMKGSPGSFVLSRL